MRKKFLKIFIINFILILIILLIAELYFSVYYTFRVRRLMPEEIIPFISRVLKSYTVTDYFPDNYVNFRLVSYPSNPSGKRPIITAGCSYTFGLYLQQEETFASRLSEATGRTVYNLGIIGGSPRELVYILSNDKIRNKFLNNETDIEYVFYTFISDHLARLYSNIKMNPLSPHFKLNKDGKLEYYKKSRLLQKSYIYRTYSELKYREKTDKESFNLFIIYMKEINQQIKKHFPNAKLVILIHEDDMGYNWSELEKEGIIVIFNSQIANIDVLSPEYTRSNIDIHPNAKAWEIIVPKIVDYLEL